MKFQIRRVCKKVYYNCNTAYLGAGTWPSKSFHAGPGGLHSRATRMGPPSSTERASFATTARLLSCLITESLLHAIFVPLQWSDCVGIGVVLKKAPAPTHNHNYKQEDVLAIMLLRHVPVLRTGRGPTYQNNKMKSADSRSSDDDPRGKEIGLLDPLDMFPLMLVTSGDGDGDGESFENEVWLICFCVIWVVLRLRTLRPFTSG